MKPSTALLFASLIAGVGGHFVAAGNLAVAAEAAKPSISADASAAVAEMSKTLQAPAFSFEAHIIREYPDKTGALLHVFHSFKVTVRRPDRLLVEGTGDDGARKLFYDGKTFVLAMDDGKKYVSLGVPGTIDAMMHEAVAHLGVDFPLADLLTSDPAKSVLSGVTAGREVNTVTIGGVPCRHLLFTQPGIELELWIENADRAVPRRVIVTYRSVAGEPSFIAELSNWNFDVKPADEEFSFQPPAGAVKVELKPAAAAGREVMKQLAVVGLGALLSLALATEAFAWGAVAGPRGGAYYRGPAGGAAVRGPYGGAAVRGPYGGAAVRGPYGGAAVRAPGYGYGYRGPVYAPGVGVAAGVAAGVAVGAATAYAAPRYYPPYYPPPYYPPPYYAPPVVVAPY